MKKILTVLVMLIMSFSMIAATKKTTVKKTSGTKKTVSSKVYQTGTASFYGGKWHGKKTANGEPFNTRVRVTNLNNGKSVIVRINNRGPYIKGRIIDLSTAAFTAIESKNKGIARVKLEIVK